MLKRTAESSGSPGPDGESAYLISRRTTLAGFCSLLVFGAPSVAAAREEMALVISMKTPTPRNLDEVKRILSGRQRRWADGTPVRLVLPPRSSPPMLWLCKDVLGLSEKAYRQHLLRKVFRNQISKPIASRSPDESRAILLATPGAIGPLPVSSMDEALRRLL